MCPNGPEVCEETQLLSNRKQPRLRSRLCVRVVPAVSTDSSEKDRIRSLGCGECRFGERVAGLVDSDAAYQVLFKAEVVIEANRNGFEHETCLFDDLGADAVTGEQCDRCPHGLKPRRSLTGRTLPC
jgi:hypothetical protein